MPLDGGAMEGHRTSFTQMRLVELFFYQNPKKLIHFGFSRDSFGDAPLYFNQTFGTEIWCTWIPVIPFQKVN
jgi:hypothetical protein